MKKNPVAGKRYVWSFSDGPMANQSFQHEFDADGTVRWLQLGDGKHASKSSAATYQAASLGQNVTAVSYLGSSGYTLTVVMLAETHELVAFASNDKSLTLQHGTFEVFDELALRRTNGAATPPAAA